jgi:hypothetical protein
MAATRSFTLLLVALVAAMATAFVPGNVVSRSSGEFLWREWWMRCFFDDDIRFFLMDVR